MPELAATAYPVAEASAAGKLRTAGSLADGPLLITTGRWFNKAKPSGKTAKAPAYKQGFTYDDFAYGEDKPAQFEPGDGVPLQDSIICAPSVHTLAIDVDYPGVLSLSQLDRVLPDARKRAISTRGDHFHVLLDMRGIAYEDWPQQGRTAWGDIKAAGFIPVPGSWHWSGVQYAPAAADWPQSAPTRQDWLAIATAIVSRQAVVATPELIAALKADRLTYARDRLVQATQEGMNPRALGIRDVAGTWVYASGYVQGSWAQLPDGFLAHDDELKDVAWDMGLRGIEHDVVRSEWRRLAGVLDASDPWTDKDFERHWRHVPGVRAELVENAERDEAGWDRLDPDSSSRSAALDRARRRIDAQQPVNNPHGFDDGYAPGPELLPPVPVFARDAKAVTRRANSDAWLGFEPFDPPGATDSAHAWAVLERTFPIARYDPDADIWVSRDLDRWVMRTGNIMRGLVTDVIDKPAPDWPPRMPYGMTKEEALANEHGYPDDYVKAERRKHENWLKFHANSGIGAIAGYGDALLRSGKRHYSHVSIRELDMDPAELWAGDDCWDLRASLERPVRKAFPRDHNGNERKPIHLKSAACAPQYVAPEDEERLLPLWTRLTTAIWPDEETREWALLCLSAGLTGDPKKVIPVLQGGTDRGKSTIAKALLSVLDSYGNVVNPKIIDGDANGHDTIYMELLGCRFAFIDEGPKAGRTATNRLKRLAGGAPITANRMRKDPVTFNPTHTLCIALNPEERLPLDDPAVVSRVRFLPCNGHPDDVIAASRKLEHFASAQWRREMPGVLGVMMRYAARVLTDPSVLEKENAPEAVRDAEQSEIRDQDDVLRWFEEATTECPAGYPSRELYVAFRKWTEETKGMKGFVISEKKWALAMDELIPEDKKGAHTAQRTARVRLRRRQPAPEGWHLTGHVTPPSPPGPQSPGPSGGTPRPPAPSEPQSPSSSVVLPTAEEFMRTPAQRAYTVPEPDLAPEPEPERQEAVPSAQESRDAPVFEATPGTEPEPVAETLAQPEVISQPEVIPQPPVVSQSARKATRSRLTEEEKAARVAQRAAEKAARAAVKERERLKRVAEREAEKVIKAEVRRQETLARQAARKEEAIRAKEEARLAKIAEIGGALVTLPAVVLRDQAISSCTPDFAARFLEPFLGELSVDVEHAGFPLGHEHYRLRLVQLGGESGAVVFDPHVPEQAAVIRDCVARARKLHAHQASADLVPLENAGLCDRSAWDRMRDSVIMAKLIDPALTDSDESGLKPLARNMLGEEYALAWKCDKARAELFSAGGWLTETDVLTPPERSGWAQAPLCENFIRYAASDVMDCAAVARALEPQLPDWLLQREGQFAKAWVPIALKGTPLNEPHVAELLERHEREQKEAQLRVAAATNGAINNPKSSVEVPQYLILNGYDLPLSSKTRKPGAPKGILEPFAASVARARERFRAGEITADELAAAEAQGDTLCADILEYRRHDTACGLLLRPWKYMCERGDGRIRSSIMSIEARTGRTSSRDFNLQQCCYDSVTDILTDQGWLPFPQVTESHRVAQWREDGTIEFTTPVRVVHEAYDGPMVSIAGEHHEQVITPNHRVYSLSQQGDVRIEYAEKWLRDHGGQPDKVIGRKVIRGGQHAGRHLSDEERLALRRAVAVQADGSLREDCRFIPLLFTKGRKVQRARELGFDVRETTVLRNNKPVHKVKAYAADCAPWLILPEKTFNIPALLELDATELQVFLDEAMFWDGDFTRGQAFNQALVRSAAVDAVELAAILTGHSTCRSIKRVDGRDYACVQVHEDAVRWASRTTVTEVPSDGMVHCVEVPSGAVVVRHGGKIIVSGNSRQGGMRASITTEVTQWMVEHGLASQSALTCGISADFNSVEVRVGAALSGDVNMQYLIKMGDLHPDKKKEYDFHWRTAITCYGNEATKENRYNSKRINFAKMFGSGKKGAAEQVGVPLQQVSAAFDAFSAVGPQYEQWDQEMRKFVRDGGRSFDAYSGRKLWMDARAEHGAGNTAIQGSARELAVDATLRWMDGPWGNATLLLVHDELIAFNIPAEDAVAATAYLVSCMETEIYGVQIKAEANDPWEYWPDAS